MGESDIIF